MVCVAVLSVYAWVNVWLSDFWSIPCVNYWQDQFVWSYTSPLLGKFLYSAPYLGCPVCELWLSQVIWMSPHWSSAQLFERDVICGWKDLSVKWIEAAGGYDRAPISAVSRRLEAVVFRVWLRDCLLEIESTLSTPIMGISHSGESGARDMVQGAVVSPSRTGRVRVTSGTRVLGHGIDLELPREPGIPSACAERVPGLCLWNTAWSAAKWGYRQLLDPLKILE